jgi:hypothetical protein
MKFEFESTDLRVASLLDTVAAQDDALSRQSSIIHETSPVQRHLFAQVEEQQYRISELEQEKNQLHQIVAEGKMQVEQVQHEKVLVEQEVTELNKNISLCQRRLNGSKEQPLQWENSSAASAAAELSKIRTERDEALGREMEFHAAWKMEEQMRQQAQRETKQMTTRLQMAERKVSENESKLDRVLEDAARRDEQYMETVQTVVGERDRERSRVTELLATTARLQQDALAAGAYWSPVYGPTLEDELEETRAAADAAREEKRQAKMGGVAAAHAAELTARHHAAAKIQARFRQQTVRRVLRVHVHDCCQVVAHVRQIDIRRDSMYTAVDMTAAEIAGAAAATVTTHTILMNMLPEAVKGALRGLVANAEQPCSAVVGPAVGLVCTAVDMAATEIAAAAAATISARAQFVATGEISGDTDISDTDTDEEIAPIEITEGPPHGISTNTATEGGGDIAPRTNSRTLYRALQPVRLRAGVDITSTETMIIRRGEEIEVQEFFKTASTSSNPEGRLRLRCDRGWASLTSRGGVALLQLVGTANDGNESGGVVELPQVTLEPYVMLISDQMKTKVVDQIMGASKRDSTVHRWDQQLGSSQLLPPLAAATSVVEVARAIDATDESTGDTDISNTDEDAGIMTDEDEQGLLFNPKLVSCKPTCAAFSPKSKALALPRSSQPAHKGSVQLEVADEVRLQPIAADHPAALTSVGLGHTQRLAAGASSDAVTDEPPSGNF